MSEFEEQSFAESLPFVIVPAVVGFVIGVLNSSTVVQPVILN